MSKSLTQPTPRLRPLRIRHHYHHQHHHALAASNGKSSHATVIPITIWQGMARHGDGTIAQLGLAQLSREELRDFFLSQGIGKRKNTKTKYNSERKNFKLHAKRNKTK